jgi:hypothetical protein
MSPSPKIFPVPRIAILILDLLASLAFNEKTGPGTFSATVYFNFKPIPLTKFLTLLGLSSALT